VAGGGCRGFSRSRCTPSVGPTDTSQALYGLRDTGNGHLRNALQILSDSLGFDCIEPTAFAISLPTFGFHLVVVETAMDVHVVHLLGDVV
jgi:hypothetical protein